MLAFEQVHRVIKTCHIKTCHRKLARLYIFKLDGSQEKKQTNNYFIIILFFYNMFTYSLISISFNLANCPDISFT